MSTETAPPDRRQLDQLWASLAQFPFVVQAACEGRAVKSLLSEVTGLSPAHISTRGLQMASPKRRLRVAQRSRDWILARLHDKGLSAQEVEKLLSEQPSTALAAFAYGLGHSMFRPLPLTVELSLRLDALMHTASECLVADDLLGYQSNLSCFWRDELSAYSAPEQILELNEMLHIVESAADWSLMLGPTERAVEYSLLALIAAIDVEWGAYHLQGLTPVPTMHWLFPRFHPDFDPGNTKGVRRNVVSHPVRHLLQILWVLAKRASHPRREWPDAPPGPSELALDVAMETLGDDVIRKITAGIRKIKLDDAIAIWAQLCRTLTGGEVFAPPLPWMMMGLWMEDALVRPLPNSSKAGTVIFLSETAFRSIWTGHRHRWAEQLPRPGDRPWPGWLLAQSSLLDWMRSSQSSGL